MTDLLPVSQADRDAAQRLADRIGYTNGITVERIAETYARHRIAHQPTQDRDAVLEEAARVADEAAERCESEAAQCYSYAEDLIQEWRDEAQAARDIATAIRALKDLSPYIGKEPNDCQE